MPQYSRPRRLGIHRQNWNEKPPVCERPASRTNLPSAPWICRRSIAAILLLWGPLWSGWPVTNADAAQQRAPAVSIERIDVGIAGYYKVGRSTPLRLRVKVERACRIRCTVDVPDVHGNRTITPGDELVALRAGLYTLTAIFQTGRPDGSVRCRVQWSESGGDRPDWRVAEERVLRPSEPDSPSPVLRPALKQSAVIVATLGRPAGFESLPELSKPLHVARIESVAQFPARYEAYDGLDVLAINGSHPWTAEQSRAVRDWVRVGGHLVVAVGGGVSEFRQGALYEWMRHVIPLAGTRQLRELSGLESAVGENAQIDVRRGESIPAAKLHVTSDVGAAPDADGPAPSAQFEGEVLAGEPRDPLVVRRAYGFGRITFFCVDLNRPPLSNWEALPNALQTLVFDEYRPRRDDGRNGPGPLADTGISDLATQWQFSLQNFPEVRRVASWKVMAWLLLYLAVIGPADYYLVRRLFRNPRFTWLTFPVMVIVAAALAIWTAGRTNGREWRLNQVDVIDVDADAPGGAEQFVRTNTWMSVYSPSTMRHRVTIVPHPIHGSQAETQANSDSARNGSDADGGHFRLSWSGVPENNFGGMYRSGGIEFGRPTYRFAPDSAAIENLPTAVWSTADLTAVRIQETGPIVESDLVSRGYGLVSGTITHHLSGPLQDWMLAYGPGVYFPAENPRTGRRAALPPDVLWTTDDPNLARQELEGYLTNTRLTKVERRSGRLSAEYRLAQTAYDPFHRDPSDILRMITFYRRAGGKQYTRLENDSLRRFDFSSLLDLDRAVLIGRLDPPAAELELNDRTLAPTRRRTFVRLVLPVRTTK